MVACFLQAGLSVVRNRVYGDKSSLAMTRALGDTKWVAWLLGFADWVWLWCVGLVDSLPRIGHVA
jgi:hypothetical protein